PMWWWLGLAVSTSSSATSSSGASSADTSTSRSTPTCGASLKMSLTNVVISDVLPAPASPTTTTRRCVLGWGGRGGERAGGGGGGRWVSCFFVFQTCAPLLRAALVPGGRVEALMSSSAAGSLQRSLGKEPGLGGAVSTVNDLATSFLCRALLVECVLSCGS